MTTSLCAFAPLAMTSHELFAEIWFVLLAVLLAGYAILDGFDLGVGILHLWVTRDDRERRLVMNSIGPLWDGNEVWLVTFGGALFAAFPEAYATVFSGFYTALMLLLFALILRAVSMEFRSKVASPVWRRFWDVMFFLGSTLATFLFGVAVANLMLGIPLDAHHEFVGSFLGLLNPYSLLVGVMGVFAFAMHGAIYLYLKTEGDFQQRLRPVMWRMFFIFLGFYVIMTGYTFFAVPRATETLNAYPWMWAVPLLNALAIANIPRAIHKQAEGYAFISSACTIAAFVFLFITALHPYLIPASNTPAHSLTIFNAASSVKTLWIMLIIAVLGMPCVIAYTAVIYWTFRGKVHLDETSY